MEIFNFEEFKKYIANDEAKWKAQNLDNKKFNEIKKIKHFEACEYLESKEYIKRTIYLINDDYITGGQIVSKSSFDPKIRRFPKVIKDWFNYEYSNFKTPVIKTDKEELLPNEFNLLPEGLHKYKPFKDFDKEAKKYALYFLNEYIRPVLCNNNEEYYKYIINWLSYMIQGNKNDSMLVLKGIEGCGKSTFTKMICDNILGRQRTQKASSKPLTGGFNSELMGKQFVYFEELRAGSKTEQEMASSALKDMITDEYMNYEAKYKTSLNNIKNVSNFVSLSNNYYAIKDNQGRRYFILDINTSHYNNKELWDNIYKKCLNKEVGHALFCYFMEVDVKNFRSQKMPLTENKISSFIKSYTPEIVFIREKYLFTKIPMNIKTNDLYNEFLDYTEVNKPSKKSYFYDKLKHYGLQFRKSNGFNKYIYSPVELQELADKFKWSFIDEAEKHEKEEGIKEDEEYTREQELINNQSKRIKEQAEEIKRLKKELEKLKIKELPEYEPKIKEPKEKQEKNKKIEEVINKVQEEEEEDEKLSDYAKNIINDVANNINEEKENLTKPKINNKVNDPFKHIEGLFN